MAEHWLHKPSVLGSIPGGCRPFHFINLITSTNLFIYSMREFFGYLNDTRGSLEMACFIVLEACKIGKCLLTIFVKPVRTGSTRANGINVVVGGALGPANRI